MFFGNSWQDGLPAPVVFDSIEKLKETEAVQFQMASEASGIQILLMESGHVFVLSDKDRVLPKSTQLGGFGTGQYVKAADCGEGITFNLHSKDRTLVQVDESTLRESAPTSAVATMSLYKLLVLTEREKGVTSHKVSYHSVSRLPDGQLEAGSDGFNVEASQDMKFRILAGDNVRVVCKNVFSKCPVQSIEHSPFVGKIFRFRFERVGLSLKVQKPYLITKVGLNLQKGKPFKIIGY